MSENIHSKTRWWLWLAITLTIFKLWLTRAQPIFAISDATHDDRLFLELAQSIVRGEWLGSYNNLTLAKGPAYSIFVALVFYLGIPLGLAQQTLYAAACAIFARAGRPIFARSTQFIVYLILLWNPMSYEAPTLARIIRQHLVTSLGIIIFAGLVALYLRRSEPFRRLWRWAVLLGLSIGIFWITREESVWILPSILLLSGAVYYGAWQISKDTFRTMIWIGLLTVVCAAVPPTLVSWKNYQHYGWFGTVEFKASEFKAAYGALQRVNIGPDIPQVPVTKEARLAIYPLSPTFAKLKPWLERDVWSEEGPQSSEHQMRGGWFMWALRESATLSGNTPNAKEALIFYQTLADEVNAACDAGLLPAHQKRDSMIPKFREGDAAEIARTVLWFSNFVVSFSSFSPYPQLSIGDREQLKLFYDMTGDQLSSSVRAPVIERPNQKALGQQKYSMLQTIGSRYISALFVLFFVSHVIALIRVTQLFRSRSLTYPMVLAAAAWGGTLSFLLINALVHVLSFPVTAVSTFSPIYPLLLIFYIAVFWDAITAWAPFTRVSPGRI